MNNYAESTSKENPFQKECNISEVKIWINYFVAHPNPVLHLAGRFLASYHDIEAEMLLPEYVELKSSMLTALEILEAESWSEYLENHSLEGLIQVSEWIPQWIG